MSRGLRSFFLRATFAGALPWHELVHAALTRKGLRPLTPLGGDRTHECTNFVRTDRAKKRIAQKSGDTLTRTAEGVKSEDYLGVWACDRCIISINADDDGFYADVDWSYSPGETLRHETWHYTCTYNTENATMECSNGKYTETNRKDENNEDVKVHYTDGTAVFVMRQGTLTWNDNMRDCAEGMTFYPAGM